ncbi:bifunctional Diphthamide synthesis DPH1-DPH2/Diphthamide synthesis DPH1-DPH2 [Babesia duncani]|uniref:Bifunctional Diphthamide synthesis DPH1-DPH2/Diphthamide synthesis DPH1-DPH2 n=1 Tax=Babesia duncani TaxID=323732 RepID=A0AAD9PJD4_9APIC|nr:bifunctional Diphthamide synthesis DPH1-DPH2/Diphthamide synthesis DPH1-DPH2 [Babesia duncani]
MQQSIQKVVNEIEVKSYKHIAIQCSNVNKAAELCLELQDIFNHKNKKEVQFYVIGDVLIGNCCTDLIAARRCQADLILHIDYSCQSRFDIDTPIRYIFSKYYFNPKDVIDKLKCIIDETRVDKILLVYNPSLHHAIDNVIKGLNIDIYVAKCFEDYQANDSNEECPTQLLGGRYIYRNNERVRIDWSDNKLLICFLNVAGECETLIKQIALESCGCMFKVLEIESNGINQIDMDRYGDELRMRRYVKIEKLYNSSTIGLLTIPKCLSVCNELRQRLSKVLKINGKKCYTFSINHLTEAKLRNFPNVDIFCLLSCAQTSLSLPEEINKMIVFPFELLVACNVLDWSTNYIFEFTQLLPYLDINHDKEGVVLNTELGVIYNRQELIERGNLFFESLTSNSNRTYKGLDPLHGLDENTTITKGSDGIACGYKHEYSAT